MAQLAQTTATIQAQLAQVHSTMSGLATTIQHQVQTTPLFQTRPPVNTPICEPVIAPEPPRIPLEAVSLSSPGYFDGMLPPNNCQQQPNPFAQPPISQSAPALPSMRPPSNWPQQPNPSAIQAQPPISQLAFAPGTPRIHLQASPLGYFDAMRPPSNWPQQPNNATMLQAQSPFNSPINQATPALEPPRIPLQVVPPGSPGYFDAMGPPTAGHSSQTFAPQRVYRTVTQ